MLRNWSKWPNLIRSFFLNEIFWNFVLIPRKFRSFLIISWSKRFEINFLKIINGWPKDQNWSKSISKNVDRWPKDQNFLKKFQKFLIIAKILMPILKSKLIKMFCNIFEKFQNWPFHFEFCFVLFRKPIKMDPWSKFRNTQVIL